MKKYLAILLLLFVGLHASAQIQFIADADKAYMNSDYARALELYRQALATDGASSQLYYNIANTYYRLGEPGNAVLYYKKSLKLDPSNADARANYSFVKTKLVDNQEESTTWTRKVSENVMFAMSPNAWAVISLIFLALFLASLGFYILGESVAVRKLAFFGGFGLLALTVLCTIVAFKTASLASSDKEAVIITPTVVLSTVPRVPQDKAEQAFTLHEGAIVEIVDSLAVPADTLNPLWLEIKVNNTHRAWISNADLRRI